MKDLLYGFTDEDGIKHNGLSSSKLTKASMEMLEKDITDDEVKGVMLHLPLGKSAGPDRIPNAVYKHLAEHLAPKLGNLLREAVTNGELPSSFMKGDITVLYKKEARNDPRNYRPITLLQNAYKIFTRVLAQRMKLVMHEFVSEAQKGFVPHAFIAECTMLMNLVETYINDDNHPERGGMMLFLDMEKAFDRVSYEFLAKAMEAVGFGDRFRRTIHMMYNVNRPPQRRIYANGYHSAGMVLDQIRSGTGVPHQPPALPPGSSSTKNVNETKPRLQRNHHW